jgi:type III secretory pathway component EscR
MIYEHRGGVTLFTRFKTKTSTLFLDPNAQKSIEYERGTKLNIILSPSLYWVKKLSLPHSSLREVKKVLPSIFEDILPASHYSYSVYKKGDYFIAFAYEDKKIIELFKRYRINYADVEGIYFAQSEFDSLEGAYRVNDKESIYLQDSLLVLVPSEWLSESRELDLESLVLSKERVKLQQFGHIVDSKSLYKIATILVLIALVLLVEVFVTKSKLSAIDEQQRELFSKYKLQSTSFQNRATLKKYRNIYKKESKLREYISYFLNLHLKEGEKIQEIELKKSSLFITISGVKKARQKTIESLLNAQTIGYKLSSRDETMHLEINL